MLLDKPSSPNAMRITEKLLRPVGALYTAIVTLRNTLYTRGIFQAHRLPCTVISVGNIVVGGTGKTPTVIAIAQQLQEDGVRYLPRLRGRYPRIAILLRGYKRQSREKITVVSDGEKRLCSHAESGDEADMMARLLPGIPIIVGRNRYAAGQLAIERFKSDVLILDDGFQHRQLHRDVDIVTVDATRPFGTGQLLPAGTLREPLTALRRADILLLTRADKPAQVSRIRGKLGTLAPNTPILESVHRPTHLYRLHAFSKPEPLSLNWLRGKRLLAICGIGNPNAFVATLNQYTPETVDLLEFPDHHAYTEADCQRIQCRLKQIGAAFIVTTQKDEQKLGRFAQELPITVLAVAVVITDGNLLASISSFLHKT